MNWADYIILFFSALYGFAKACTDTKRDKKTENTIFYYPTIRYRSFGRWYNAGNDEYNPSIFGNFWHFFDKLKLVCFAFGLGIVGFGTLPFYVWPPTVFLIASLVFSIFYHTILPIDRESLWRSVKRIIFPFKNYHD